MSYYGKIAAIAEKIQDSAEKLSQLKKHRSDWIKPEGTTFWVGVHQQVTRNDGTTPAHLQGIKREAIKAFDDLILAEESKLEGLRWKLIQLGKEGTTS